jgi:(2R)-sulfolactate sulfo-lyase subunit alpha
MPQDALQRHDAEIEYCVLLHQPIDDVGVVIVDLAVGEQVGAVTLEGEHLGSVGITEDVPLGHKVAIRDIPSGKEVIKYGRPIGRATRDILAGAWVHTHNLKSMRWAL